uniref:Uncharacterized protein n=1 Tax=Romanomermis culicivorax TaxID=13658 RepID=A0A915I709_ROMCU
MLAGIENHQNQLRSEQSCTMALVIPNKNLQTQHHFLIKRKTISFMVQPNISVATGLPPSPPPLVCQLPPIFSSSINAQEWYAAWVNSSECQNDVSFFMEGPESDSIATREFDKVRLQKTSEYLISYPKLRHGEGYFECGLSLLGGRTLWNSVLKTFSKHFYTSLLDNSTMEQKKEYTCLDGCQARK